MAMPNPYQQYQMNSVNSAPPGELTLMLYSGAVRFINAAIKGVDENNLAKANQNIIKAQEIILYLSATLNMDYEISKNLASLYDFMYHRLVQANISKDQQAMLEVLGLIEDLRNTWSEMLRQNKGQG